MSPRVKRKPGGQPGNQNARKHGCYSKILSPEEQRLLTIASIPGIDAEIALLRTRIRTLIQQECCPTDPLVRTMQSLCRVVRLHSNLASLREFRSLAGVQLTALEKRLEARNVIPKLVDTSQKNYPRNNRRPLIAGRESRCKIS